MNSPYSSPRRLTRSRSDRMLAGVCGGIAEYLNMDPTLVRVLVVVIALITAAFPVAIIYLILMMVIPEAQPVPPPSVGPGQQQGYQPWQPYQAQQTDPVWGSQGAPWEQSAAPANQPQSRPSSQDLFSRARHPGQPSGSTGYDGTGSQPEPGAADSSSDGTQHSNDQL